MSPRVRHEQEKEQMKQLILKAAIEITADIGYEKLSMRKIADVIGYTPTTIYLYYKDKEEIVADIFKIVYREIILNVQNVIHKNTNLPIDQQLKLILESFIETIVSKPEMGKVIIASGPKTMFGTDSREDVAGHGEEHGLDILHQFLIRGVQQGIFRPLDENMSWMVITALIGFSIGAIENKMYLQENWKHLVHVYTEMLINGLLVKKEQPLDVDAILDAIRNTLIGEK